MIPRLMIPRTATAACRTAFRRSALPFGISSGLLLAYNQHAQPMRLDAVPVASRQYSKYSAPPVQKEERLTTDQAIRQLAAGSMGGKMELKHRA